MWLETSKPGKNRVAFKFSCDCFDWHSPIKAERTVQLYGRLSSDLGLPVWDWTDNLQGFAMECWPILPLDRFTAINPFFPSGIVQNEVNLLYSGKDGLNLSPTVERRMRPGLDIKYWDCLIFIDKQLLLFAVVVVGTSPSMDLVSLFSLGLQSCCC